MANVGLDLMATALLVGAVSSNNGETQRSASHGKKRRNAQASGSLVLHAGASVLRPDTVSARSLSFAKSAETTVDVPPEPDKYTQVWSTWTGEAKHSCTIERDLEANNILVVDGIGRPVNGRYEVIGSRNSMRMWRKVGWNGPYISFIRETERVPPKIKRHPLPRICSCATSLCMLAVFALCMWGIIALVVKLLSLPSWCGECEVYSFLVALVVCPAISSFICCCYCCGACLCFDSNKQDHLKSITKVKDYTRKVEDTKKVVLRERGYAASRTAAAVAPSPRKGRKSGGSRRRPTPSAPPPPLDSVATCVVCIDAPPTHCFSPCGHKAICEDCASHPPSASGWKKCPVCRNQVSAVIRIFE